MRTLSDEVRLFARMSIFGLVVGGVITTYFSWRWVMFINPVICVLLLPAVYRLIDDDRRTPSRVNFDFLGTVLATGSNTITYPSGNWSESIAFSP